MFVDTPGGGRIRVEVHGTGNAQAALPPIVLLHGFTGGANAWPAPLLSGLARGRRVLAVDLPGHGGSDLSTDPRRYQIERVVADLVALLDAEGVEAADWVGYSMGGRIALAAAVRCPNRVRRLVLESASPGLALGRDRASRQAADNQLADDIERNFSRFVDGWMALPLFEGQQRLGKPWLTKERQRRLSQHPQAMAACLRGLGTGSQPSFWDALRGLSVPTLALVGSLDAKFVAIAEQMADRAPAAQWLAIDSAGHTTHAEATEMWLKQVRTFLSPPESVGS